LTECLVSRWQAPELERSHLALVLVYYDPLSARPLGRLGSTRVDAGWQRDLAGRLDRTRSQRSALCDPSPHPRRAPRASGHRALASLGEAMVLTPRELEVASLAAGGLLTGAIAECLVISTRTREHHLERAYRKLGVSDRSAPAEHLTAPAAGIM
jgi:DNA-binding NarL/FixJ family response regulator